MPAAIPAGATITINLSPGNVSAATATASNAQVSSRGPILPMPTSAPSWYCVRRIGGHRHAGGRMAVLGG